jgi:hypothetical protein
MRTDELQDRLRSLGFDPGPSDGMYGPLTEDAIFDMLDEYAPLPAPPEVEEGGEGTPVPGIVPPSWMPDCNMERVICHWTAGTHKAGGGDTPHYHILIEGDGTLVRGSYSIKDNVSTSDGTYAAHTKNLNTGSIGVSLCCMSGAKESPFDAGDYPMTEDQWETLVAVVADLCAFYNIPVTLTTVLSHAEVQANCGVAQEGKWDYTRLAFDSNVQGARECGDKLRREVQGML